MLTHELEAKKKYRKKLRIQTFTQSNVMFFRFYFLIIQNLCRDLILSLAGSGPSLALVLTK